MTKSKFLQLLHSPFKMRIFFLQKLPGLWFFGMRIKEVTPSAATVALPYAWRSMNPFKSTYFAAQLAVAEFSTGILVMYHLQELPPFSMLVTEVRSEFFKKTSETIYFTCTQGDEVAALIAKGLADGEGHTIRLQSTGTTADGTVISKAEILWSLKRKKG